MSENRTPPASPEPPGVAAAPGYDPDATITGPLVAGGAGAAVPATRVDDPDATVSGPLAEVLQKEDADPEITLQPQPRKIDPDATFSGPLFDPDATVTSPAARRRSNPFKPKALPEALQANLAALGGLNPLVAFANPILSAIPQLRVAHNHPDPARLKETLEDLVEAFEAGAGNAGTPDAVLEAAVYTLCCLADDAAASTTWGRTWEKDGLLQKMRGETTGGTAFFDLVKSKAEKPEGNADLLELMYICLALGFEGRYRGVEGGREALGTVRTGLHVLVTRRRPRPQQFSERWKGVPAETVPVGIQPSRARATKPAGRFGGIAGAAVAVLLGVFVGIKMLRPPAPEPSGVAGTTSPTTSSKTSPATSPAPAAAPVSAATPHKLLERALSAELKGGLVALKEEGGRSVVFLRDEQQFASGQVEPAPAAKAVIENIGVALKAVPGPVLVRGYADGMPVKPGTFASNLELSAARARVVAGVLSAGIGEPQRV